MLEFLQDHLQKRQVALISVSEKLDPSSALGNFIVGMLAISAQLFAESTAENVKESMKRRREAGYPTGRVGYGWRQGYLPDAAVEEGEAR